MITKEGIIQLNKKFDNGTVVNGSSLSFALSSLKGTKDWFKQLAYLVRAIVVDHVFEEGNKRTASAIIIYFFEAHKVAYDPYKVDKIITEIILKNIVSVEQIRRKLKDVIR
ncbi:MAG: Fic family protein [Candidatus Nanoarchaeia archaeon]|nr:Fic family protein [Candidatus Nanoarchaeia archaeon]